MTVFHESWLKDSDYAAWLGKHGGKGSQVSRRWSKARIETQGKRVSYLFPLLLHLCLYVQALCVTACTRAHTSDRYNISLLDFSHFVFGYFR